MIIERFILARLLGWKVVSNFPDGVKKSIIVFAPHTSYWDAVIGKLVLRAYDVPHQFLSKKELFRFPMGIVMHLIGAMPIRGVKGQNAIYHISHLLAVADEKHFLICPEGGFAPTDRWDAGFYYMAYKARVPLVVVYLDYKRKEAGVKGVIYDLDNQNDVYRQLAEMYRGVTARHPDRFLLPKYKA
ncbi:MAG: 1-acyl-sn-glycerol-3-phosphate acyltransferase [Prevotella sp.]|nr:1-acyl-sn-glycerol-3-phosphate acyltransferase [Prevotella sp.]